MSEFLKYIFGELGRYFALALIAGVCAFAVLGVLRYLHKRRYGKETEFPWKRILLFMAFIGYLACVFFVTNFRASRISREVNLHLFRAWREALNNFSQQLWLNVLLNIAMFLPFGFLLPLLGRKFRRWNVTIPLGFLTSMVIEVLQFLFARGVFDVDDLFCNTLGTVIGFFFAMFFLSFHYEKGKRWKPALLYTALLMISFTALGSIFLLYQGREFGYLPEGPAYTINTRGTEWKLVCELPESVDTAAVYQTRGRTAEECDAFAEAFKKIIPTEFEDISYYQEAAYYMDHGNGDAAHFLFVNYLDQGYEYTAIYDDEPVWAEADRDTILKVLEKYPLTIPEAALFQAEGEGWFCFSASQLTDGERVYNGSLRVRISAEGLVREIENQLLTSSFYRNAEVITPEVALERLKNGKFNDEGYFERRKPAEVSILACVMEYRVDTKGFYQPVYVFDVASDDGSYRDRILIPAMK